MAKKIKRAKLSELSVKQRAFLAAYAITGIIASAARAAKVPRVMHYMWLWHEDPNYRLAFREAKGEAIDALEAEARRRAIEGVARLKFHKGEIIMIPGPDGKEMIPYVEHEYSDRLLEFILGAARPKKFRANQKVEVKGQINTLPANGITQLPTKEEAIAKYRVLLSSLEREGNGRS